MMQIVKIGLMLVCLSVLYGCSSNPVPVVINNPLPLAYLTSTPECEFTATTHGDLIEWAQCNRERLQRCNDDKNAIRVWSEDSGEVD